MKIKIEVQSAEELKSLLEKIDSGVVKGEKKRIDYIAERERQDRILSSIEPAEQINLQLLFQNDVFTNIKYLRKMKKITQEQCATDIKIASGTIRKYENRERIPNAINLCKLAKYFDVDPIALLGTTISE